MLSTEDEGSLRRLAFTNQYNLILLGGAVAFAAALWTPWPLIAAGLGELFWLTIGVSSAGFRQWAEQQKHEEVRHRRLVDDASVVKALEPIYSTRVKTLHAMADEIRRLSRERGFDARLFDGGRDGGRDGKDDKLSILIGSFVKMAV